MHAGRTENGRAEPEVAQGDPAPWSNRRRNAPPASDHVDRTGAGYGLLQRSGQRMAASKSEAGCNARAVLTTRRESPREHRFRNAGPPTVDVESKSGILI